MRSRSLYFQQDICYFALPTSSLFFFFFFFFFAFSLSLFKNLHQVIGNTFYSIQPILSIPPLRIWHTDFKFPSQISLTVKYSEVIFADGLKRRCCIKSGLTAPTVFLSCLMCCDADRTQLTCQYQVCLQRSRIPAPVQVILLTCIFYCYLKKEFLNPKTFLKQATLSQAECQGLGIIQQILKVKDRMYGAMTLQCEGIEQKSTWLPLSCP